MLSVNGIATPDWTAFVRARNANKDAMVVELFRDGAIIVLDVPLAQSAPLDPPALLAEMIAMHIVPLANAPGELN